MWLFALFLAVPLIEIALFIKIGGWLTLWPTLAIVVITGILGTWLVRQQGLRALAELRGSFGELRDPTAPLAHGALILFAGALLLTPGFFTDTIGFLLMIPVVRTAVIRWVAKRVKFESVVMGGARPRHGPASDETIDGDFEEVDNPRTPVQGPSGWTRH